MRSTSARAARTRSRAAAAISTRAPPPATAPTSSKESLSPERTIRMRRFYTFPGPPTLTHRGTPPRRRVLAESAHGAFLPARGDAFTDLRLVHYMFRRHAHRAKIRWHLSRGRRAHPQCRAQGDLGPQGGA